MKTSILRDPWGPLELLHRFTRAIVLGIVMAVLVIAGASALAGCASSPARAEKQARLAVLVQTALADGILTDAEAQEIAGALTDLDEGGAGLPEWVTVAGSILAAGATTFLGVPVAVRRAQERATAKARTNPKKTQEEA